MGLEVFHSAVSAWFNSQYACPTDVQTQAWRSIVAGKNTLIAAPTGSGKTLAAFLAAINDLVQIGLAGPLTDQTLVLYVSPLKALSNDVEKNLQSPLLGVRDELLMHGLPDVNIRAWVRTGDTPNSQREQMRRRPPHILVTTPESLYILLSSQSGRAMLRSVRSVIIDEIHALAGNKRGSHLALSIQRLLKLCKESQQGNLPQRIGLSATQKPIDDMLSYLVGGDHSRVEIVDIGANRKRDLQLELLDSPLEALMSNEVWQELYDRLTVLINEHTTTLIFVNTRRLAERVARYLAERLSDEEVTAHHGSLSKEHRLSAEQKLKSGKLKALVATASLELGIDIGDVDLVCQIGSPKSIATLVQRVGRAGHNVTSTSKGRLFPLSRDDLLECVALLHAVNQSELDRIRIPEKPMDVLAQQIVAEVSSNEEISTSELFEWFRGAWPYRRLSKQEFQALIYMLADGFSTRRGRRGAFLHYDGVNGRLRPKRGARLTALTNGGAIPDQFDADVFLQPENIKVGTLNEDFAFESIPGDIFQLGNTSYRILKVEQGTVHVADAKGQPPNIPFWFGEAPGRSDELSKYVSDLRIQINQKLETLSADAVTTWAETHYQISAHAAQQLVHYLAAAKAALKVLPSQDTIVFERFFDQVGDMHFIIHSPMGSRINRAWGLSLRKRFCRKFNFELQAAALEDSIVLSLGATHSFPLHEVAGYLRSTNVKNILVQALLDAPMFATRWRWNANIALAVRRNRNGKKVPPQFQRSDAEDLMAVVFPDQLACLENIRGEREVPDHPLVTQCLHDCLTDTMDIDGLTHIIRRIEKKEISIVCKDLTEPSPLAQEILNARPYAFLDDAPAEERRTQAVQQNRNLSIEWAAGIDQVSAESIAKVQREAWPMIETREEFHDALVLLGFIIPEDAQYPLPGANVSKAKILNQWQSYFEELAQSGRATRLVSDSGRIFWVATERIKQFQLIHPRCTGITSFSVPQRDRFDASSVEIALVELVRSRLEGLGPISANDLQFQFGVTQTQIDLALSTLEQEGFVLRTTRAQQDATEIHWCERRLLARIHQYNRQQRRKNVEPVSVNSFIRFLLHWHHVQTIEEENASGPSMQVGVHSLLASIEQLEGFSIPASAWESLILPARMEHYSALDLDYLCNSGMLSWFKRTNTSSSSKKVKQSGPVKSTPIVISPRSTKACWLPNRAEQPLSSAAKKLYDLLQHQGALFFQDLVQISGFIRTQVETSLAELVANGLVTSDSFSGLRALCTVNKNRRGFTRNSRRRLTFDPFDNAGRWTLLDTGISIDSTHNVAESGRTTNGLSRNLVDTSTFNAFSEEQLKHICRTLLLRYGVVFKQLLDRESNLPSWRNLHYFYRRMEARGEIRGGRFITGIPGEQFALVEAVGLLRKVHRSPIQNKIIAISSVDPLNLFGIITPDPRIPANLKTSILIRDGEFVGTNSSGQSPFSKYGRHRSPPPHIATNG